MLCQRGCTTSVTITPVGTAVNKSSGVQKKGFYLVFKVKTFFNKHDFSGGNPHQRKRQLLPNLWKRSKTPSQEWSRFCLKRRKTERRKSNRANTSKKPSHPNAGNHHHHHGLQRIISGIYFLQTRLVCNVCNAWLILIVLLSVLHLRRMGQSWYTKGLQKPHGTAPPASRLPAAGPKGTFQVCTVWLCKLFHIFFISFYLFYFDGIRSLPEPPIWSNFKPAVILGSFLFFASLSINFCVPEYL